MTNSLPPTSSTAEDSTHPRPRFPLRRLILFSLLLAIILIPWAIREYRLSRIPLIPEPFDVETFIKDSKIPDDQNAFVEYKQATELFQDIPDWQKLADFVDPVGTPWSNYPPLAREYVAKNEQVFQIWLTGTRKPKAVYVTPDKLQIDTLMLEVQKLRGVARLVVWKAVQLQDEGKFDEAWQHLVGLQRTSVHLCMSGTIIERLVGCALNGISIPYIIRWAEDPRLTPDQLRQALADLREVNGRLPTVANNLKSEYMILRDPRNSFLRMNSINNTSSNNPAESAPERVYHRSATWLSKNGTYFFLSASGEYELVRRIQRHIFANWLAHEGITRHERLQQSSQLANRGDLVFDAKHPADAKLTTKEINQIAKSSFLYQQMMPAVNQFFEAADRDLIRRHMLEIILALQIYQREHGDFPSKLDELVPSILPSLPENTYSTDGGRIPYQVEPDHAVLWSHGPYAPVPPKEGPLYGFNSPQGFTIFMTIYPPGTRPPLYRP
ncbi:MAG: hypothetical protein KDA36_11800, partial [Planctomycetaceae bacterium]|nr:hypothetical protein [Planctomycetaceae bacterium]